MLYHPIPPVFDAQSRVLLLGSFPSVKSREQGFFYGHPQNRFWRVLATLFDAPVPQSVEEKAAFLLRQRLAVWDVLAACEITGSSDASIRDAAPNDLSRILGAAPIRAIFVNGHTAEKYYMKYSLPATGREAVCLPSTSPANAGWSLERLVAAWQPVLTAARREEF